MPHFLTVTDVRNAIYFAADAEPGQGEVSTALIGRLFHETFRNLTGSDSRVNIVRPLEQSDRDLEAWQNKLVRHAYLWCVGPQIVQHQSALQESSGQILSYWKAVENLCRWLCDVIMRHSKPAQSIEEVRRYIFAANEVDCQMELSDPGWHDSVILQGRIDAVLRQPIARRLCAVEIKLGQTHPEADLAQACLYHMLLAQVNLGERESDLALWTFQPEGHEHVWRASELKQAQFHLKRLVGKLAKVDQRPLGPPPPIPEEKPLKEMAQRLISGFQEFGAPILMEGSPRVGPSFYRFLAKPAKNVRAEKILNMGTTLWPRLKTDQPPQISMEHGLVNIDVQRPDRKVLMWNCDVLPKPEPTLEGTSRFPIGMTVEGTWNHADLSETEHSHFLVAGTNGSGKSEWLKMVVGSLCAANTPGTLSLVLIDPKRTAFPALASSPFLLRPIVIPAEHEVPAVLDQLILEMDRRYSLFQKIPVTDLKSYNNSIRERLPRIICICDEYADLVLADPKKAKELERRIGRIGALGRAAGVHLMLATQRPSKEVVKGVIKANMNARVALKVNARIDSHIILEEPGAETLLGKGDLLFKDLGKAIRLQAPLITDAELKKAAGC